MKKKYIFKSYIIAITFYFIFNFNLLAQNRFLNNHNNTKINISGYGALTTNYSKQYLKNRNINHAQTFADGGANFNISYNPFKDMTIGVNALIDTKYDKYYWQHDKGILRELYTYIQNEYARLEFGKTLDIAGKMQVSAPDVGLFEINDSYIYNILLLQQNGSKKFFINPSTDISLLKKHDRISIITSNKNKLRFGASYTFPEKKYLPNSTAQKQQFELNEEMSIATKFSTNFMGNNNISMSVGYSKYNNLNIANFAVAKKRSEISSGISIFTKGATFGASILKINEIQFDNLIISNIFKYSYSGWAYNAGFAFEIGPWATSMSYHGSIAEGDTINPQKDKSHTLLFSARRNLRKHLSFYTSIAGLILKDENKNKGNKGISISIGTILKF